MKQIGEIALCTLITLVIQGCVVSNIENQPQAQTNSEPAAIKEDLPETPVAPEPPKDAPFDYYNIRTSIGLLHFTEKRVTDDKVIRLYNDDGSLWFAFSLNDEETARQTIEGNKDLQPFRADMDNSYAFVFNCVGQDRRYYHVVVNEDTGSKKFIRKDDPHFKLGTWEQYILDCFAVDFRASDNPLREEPKGPPITVDASKRPTFHPEKIDGDWLRVRWSEGDDDTKEIKYGWIKWKEKEKEQIIIYFFEMA